MGRGAEFQELAIAKAQMLAAKDRMAGNDGLREQEKANRQEFAQRVSGALFGILLFASLVLSNSAFAIYMYGVTGIFAVAYIAALAWRYAATRKKRERDFRMTANETAQQD